MGYRGVKRTKERKKEKKNSPPKKNSGVLVLRGWCRKGSLGCVVL